MIDVKETLNSAAERMEMAAMYLAEELSQLCIRDSHIGFVIAYGDGNIALMDDTQRHGGVWGTAAYFLDIRDTEDDEHCLLYTSCNKFFEARNKQNAGSRSEEHANLDKKRNIIAQLKELVVADVYKRQGWERLTSRD